MITVEQIKKVMQKDCDLSNSEELDMLFNDLDNNGLLEKGLSITGRGSYSGDSYWLQAEYYSPKLNHTIILDYDFCSSYSDCEEIAEDINYLYEKIDKIEKRIK